MNKLIKVMSYAKPLGKVVYTGYFEDETTKVLRRSFRDYKSVAQLASAPGKSGQEEFLFSSKSDVSLGKAQWPRLVAMIPVEENEIWDWAEK